MSPMMIERWLEHIEILNVNNFIKSGANSSPSAKIFNALKLNYLKIHSIIRSINMFGLPRWDYRLMNEENEIEIIDEEFEK
jgi:hypothetical protein